MNIYYESNDELTHHGILGMKWGVRRYQNKDGSLTPAGKKRYSDNSPYEVRTADGETFIVKGRGADPRKYNVKNKSKVVKTWGDHLYEKDFKKEINKQNSKAIKEGRIIDIRSDDVIGVKQKNGDVLFVDRNLYLTRGVNFAEASAHKLLKEATANREKLKKAKKFVDEEQRALVEETLATYDKSDPDMKEAMALLRDIRDSNK